LPRRAATVTLRTVTAYRNRSGNSGVTAFELGDDWIAVRFRSGTTYRYTSAITGAQHVAEMKRRAFAGNGLSSYISEQVGDRYAERY
jgi:hypothetical protein